MNRIEQRFEALRERGEKAFIPFITAGDPDLDATARIVRAVDRAGADIVELGVPFSDPLADGPVNQEAAHRALKHNVTLKDILHTVAEIRRDCEVPLLLFTYYNPVLAYGAPKLASDAATAGIDGILCVDLPPEEAQEHEAAFRSAGLATVYLLAPTSTDARIQLVVKHSTGFIYYVSRTGITGERDNIEDSVRPMIEAIKKHTTLPVAVGFGISNAEQAREVAQFGDGVVVGSAIVRMIGTLGDRSDLPDQVELFVKSLVDATKGRTG